MYLVGIDEIDSYLLEINLKDDSQSIQSRSLSCDLLSPKSLPRFIRDVKRLSAIQSDSKKLC